MFLNGVQVISIVPWTEGNVLINDALNTFLFTDLWLRSTYTLFHEKISTFFKNKISLPERRNKMKSVLEITKMYYFFNLNDKIIFS